MDSLLERQAGASRISRRWFYVLAVMSTVQLLPALCCPYLAISLAFLGDNMNYEPAVKMLRLSMSWLLGNALANIITLCLCIYAASRYFMDPMLSDSATVRSHLFYSHVNA
jgi:hypothetical protein